MLPREAANPAVATAVIFSAGDHRRQRKSTWQTASKTERTAEFEPITSETRQRTVKAGDGSAEWAIALQHERQPDALLVAEASGKSAPVWVSETEVETFTVA